MENRGLRLYRMMLTSRRIEEAVAERAGVRYALAVNAGTSGLYLALAGLGVNGGERPGVHLIEVENIAREGGAAVDG